MIYLTAKTLAVLLPGVLQDKIQEKQKYVHETTASHRQINMKVQTYTEMTRIVETRGQWREDQTVSIPVSRQNNLLVMIPL